MAVAHAGSYEDASLTWTGVKQQLMDMAAKTSKHRASIQLGMIHAADSLWQALQEALQQGNIWEAHDLQHRWDAVLRQAAQFYAPASLYETARCVSQAHYHHCLCCFHTSFTLRSSIEVPNILSRDSIA